MPAPFVKVHHAAPFEALPAVPSGGAVGEMQIKLAWRLTAIERLSASGETVRWDTFARGLSRWTGYLSLAAGGAAVAWALGLLS